MKIDVLEDKKRVEVWVGNSEKDSEYVKLSLESLVKKYASERFLVSVFYSGGRDLFKNTEDLILHNKLCGAD